MSSFRKNKLFPRFPSECSVKAVRLVLMALFCGMSAFFAPATYRHLSAIQVSGNQTIRGAFEGSEIVIKTTERLAGAIDSLTWNGKEFVDSRDHGRQIQSASNFDAGSRFTGETFNPTEAGSRFDGAGKNSSSKLLHIYAHANQLQSTNQMAFWLRPGERSNGHLAKNATRLSNHLITKRVTIGYRDFPNVIEYNVTFSVPLGEKHRYAQFEAVTGYMPSEFSEFYRLDLERNKIDLLTDGPGEQEHPVIFSTKDLDFAMGIYSPDQPSKGYENAGYGRFRFENQKVVKWNSVFRLKSAKGIPAGDFSFRNFIIIGDLKQVHQTMAKLSEMYRLKPLKKPDGK